MLLRLLVIFYFAFDAAFLGDYSSSSRGSLVGCLSVPQPIQYHEDVYEELFWRQSSDQQDFGIKMFSQANYLGNGTVITNVSANTPISVGGSFQVLATTWAAITSPSDNNTVIVRYSVRDTSALPLPSGGQLVITNIQSSRCSPPCAGAGTCDPFAKEAQCKCPDGFNGTMCQSCADGHFGPKCQPCPSNCTTSCDQGMSGSGRCLTTTPVRSRVAVCNSNNGQCNCPPGQGNNGTACAQCQPGFFSNSTGGCEVCGFGCAVCDHQTGNCNTCQNGFTLASDTTKCEVLPQKSTGEQCPPQSYSNGTGCPPCPNPGLCPQCKGPSSNDCLVCAKLLAMFKNSCVKTDVNGICEGSGGMIADNNKKKCESCAAVEPNCASCIIKGFNVGSTINQAKCTGCLDGFFLSPNGTCSSSCPSNTFASNNTCTKCSSQCETCAGTADQCVTCAKGLFASSGKCVSTCPQATFSSNGTCTNCHPDCGTCKGTSFNECLTCSPNLPVLESGRCLATCNQTTQPEFFDTAASTCHNCDPSCLSCSGSGPNNCLACTNPTFMVVNGVCSPTPQLVPAGQFSARWT